MPSARDACAHDTCAHDTCAHDTWARDAVRAASSRHACRSPCPQRRPNVLPPCPDPKPTPARGECSPARHSSAAHRSTTKRWTCACPAFAPPGLCRDLLAGRHHRRPTPKRHHVSATPPSSRVSRRRLFQLGAGGAGLAVAGSLLPPSVQQALASPPRRGGLKAIKHVVVLVQENRSFDHYYGTLRGVRGFGDRN